MPDLHIPEIRVEVDEADYARVVAEPLETGFGTTLGNALRRVLLSSLPGAAITSVRIEGVEHEFSTIEHVQEDVTEILLNLKEVRLRSFSDRPARLFLEASGEGVVTAGDIQSSADYEVVNPELKIATLDHKDASLVADINVESGRGFLGATVSEGLPIGVIPVDALFSPVRRVNYHVAHTRVGQDTDFDRLELELWTDGTVTGPMAVSLASELLRDQLLGFQRLGRPDSIVTSVMQEQVGGFDGYDTPIEELDLSVRAYNCLKRSGLTTVGAILERSEEELLALRNFGEKSYEELRDKLVSKGFPAPRIDSRRAAVANGIGAGNGGTMTADAPRGMANDEPADEVGSLGAALIQALREAGEDPATLGDDDDDEDE
ncbi:MAG: DNA-directed RNA polymerase subunit alpha [Chloroflexi bacterium]|nr:MAG: DNA-directed RNA polymerase subunit alpha [Chloroflexota bacterium]